MHVLVPDLPEPYLDTPAAREGWEFALNTGFAARLTELHRTAPCGAVYERYSLFGTAGAEFAARHGLPYIVEVNPNPDLNPDAGVARALKAARIPYHAFIRRMLRWTTDSSSAR